MNASEGFTLLTGLFVGGVVGGVVGGMFVWGAARARWLEREAQIEVERDQEAQVRRWREESIRRGMVHELEIPESAAGAGRAAREVPMALKLARGKVV